MYNDTPARKPIGYLVSEQEDGYQIKNLNMDITCKHLYYLIISHVKQ